MNLLVYIDTATDASAASFAGGVVVVDLDTARVIHQAGYTLRASSPHAAAFASLARALGVVMPMSPRRLEIRVASGRVVNQITGVEPLAVDEPEIEPLYEASLASLLRVDNWQISMGRDGEGRPAMLASASVAEGRDIVDLDAPVASVRQKKSHTGIPQWTVELLEEPGIDCPARCHQGVRYPFGPDVPGGFCVHAAAVALADGPLRWTDPQQTRMTTVCPFCDVPVQIELVP